MSFEAWERERRLAQEYQQQLARKQEAFNRRMRAKLRNVIEGEFTVIEERGTRIAKS